MQPGNPASGVPFCRLLLGFMGGFVGVLCFFFRGVCRLLMVCIGCLGFLRVYGVCGRFLRGFQACGNCFDGVL